MKKSATLFAMLAFHGSAFAADMALKTPIPAPDESAPTWAGLYGGVDAGWGWTTANATGTAAGAVAADFAARIPPFAANADGGLFGLQLGYNWEAARWIFGLEADVDAASLLGSQQSRIPIPGNGDIGYHFGERVTGLASLRGRIGYSTGPGLLYVAGGPAWQKATAQMTVCDTSFGGCSASNYDFTSSGWTIGGGYEWMFAPHWSARAEYRYYAFNAGRADTATVVSPGLVGGTFTTNPARQNINVALLALDYHVTASTDKDVGAAAAVPTKALAAADANWSGLYGGVNGGWGWTSANGTATPSGAVTGLLGTFVPPLSVKNEGGLLGLQLGYNWQTGPWIFGLEGDTDAASISGTQQTLFVDAGGFEADLTGQDRVNWLATLRGRLGYNIGPGLLYATGGAAWENAGIKTTVCSGNLGECALLNYSFTKPGWALGGGYEWMVARQWSVRAEYLHYGFAAGPAGSAAFSTTFGVPGLLTVAPTRQDIDVLRLGLNYHFTP